MTEKIDHRRCGYCGRKFLTKKWQENFKACEKCGMYVCHDCFRSVQVCPECGSTVYRCDEGQINSMLLLFVIIFSTFTLTFAMQPPGFPNEICIFIVPLTILLIFLPLIVKSYFDLKNLRKKHIERLSKMPDGVIPVDQRTNFYDLNLKEKRDESIKKARWRHQILAEELFFRVGFFDLLGNWNFPVLSKKERVEYIGLLMRDERKILKYSIIFIIIVFSLGIVASFYSFAVFCFIIAITCCLLFVGFIILWTIRYAEKAVVKETKYKVSTGWKNIGFKKMVKNLDSFMKQYGEKYEKKVKKLSSGHEKTYLKVEYHFDNGNHIITDSDIICDGRIGNALTIEYYFSHYNHARKLQMELDRYLVERDLIDRS